MLETQERRVRDHAISSDGRRAVAALYRDFAGPLFGWLCHRLPSKQVVEDVQSEIWIRAAAGIDALRVPEARRPWLYSIAANAVAQYYREARKSKEILVTDIPLLMERRFADSQCEPEVRFEIRASLGRIMRLVSQMPLLHRDVFLAMVSGFDYKEIGEHLHLTQPAVRVIVHRLRKKLNVGLGRRSSRGACRLCIRGIPHQNCRPQ